MLVLDAFSTLRQSLDVQTEFFMRNAVHDWNGIVDLNECFGCIAKLCGKDFCWAWQRLAGTMNAIEVEINMKASKKR